MTQDLGTLLTALDVVIDDELEGTRRLVRPPRLTDSELVGLAVAQVLLGFASEAHWIRFAHAHLARMFPHLPRRPGWALASPPQNRRTRRAVRHAGSPPTPDRRPRNLLLIADKRFAVRVAQRILAMTTAIWHNHHTGAPDH